MPSAPSKDKAELRRRKELARIAGLLKFKRVTLTKIDQDYKLPRGTAGNTLYEPHIAGELAIAAALGTLPHLLWRSRYHSDGRRFRPQPADNYRHGRRLREEDIETGGILEEAA